MVVDEYDLDDPTTLKVLQINSDTRIRVRDFNTDNTRNEIKFFAQNSMSSLFIKKSLITVQRPAITVVKKQDMPIEMAAEDFFGIDLHQYFSFEGYDFSITGIYKTLNGIFKVVLLD